MNDRLIKESDVLKAIDKRIKELSKHPEFVRKNGHIDVIGVKKYILAIPSADRPQGEWVYHKDNMPCIRWDRWECDQCHNRTEYISDYCPNCGAKMVREEGEEE